VEAVVVDQFGFEFTPRNEMNPDAVVKGGKAETEEARLLAVFTRSKSWQRIQGALSRAVRPFPEAWRALGMEMRKVCLALEGAA
jgi:hypothetical protein